MAMTEDHVNATAVKEALDGLIHGVSGHSFEVLDNLYHRDMQTYVLLNDGTLMRNDKNGFMAFIKNNMGVLKDDNPWVKYHLVEADDTHGHIVVSRKNDATGRYQLISLSIDFVLEDGRWQITREIIMTRNEAVDA
ncbi:hypothetical protein CLV78_113126 [Aliiruegeria haliotis]|uniref:Nuclear transport factor 2 family protein n=1 Tax=Aliiruegeria haliotis TaxID=1280846 RepID=A0A2T0RHB1_9RHOB|nr:hypothetical protein [Aliiruegeria haliotis]PRY20527.1 hypothetical protein CLV78_113126 [Aliiruegeria haliotis]